MNAKSAIAPFVLILLSLATVSCADQDFDGRYQPSDSSEELQEALSSFVLKDFGYDSFQYSQSCITPSSSDYLREVCITFTTPTIIDRGLEGYELFFVVGYTNWGSEDPALCRGFEIQTGEFTYRENATSCEDRDYYKGAGVKERNSYYARPPSLLEPSGRAVERWKALNRMTGEDSIVRLTDTEGRQIEFAFSSDSLLSRELSKTFNAIAALERGLG